MQTEIFGMKVFTSKHVPRGEMYLSPSHGTVMSDIDFAQIEMRVAGNLALVDPLPFMEMDDYDDAFEYGVRTVEEVLASQLWKKTRPALHPVPRIQSKPPVMNSLKNLTSAYENLGFSMADAEKAFRRLSEISGSRLDTVGSLCGVSREVPQSNQSSQGNR